MSSGLTPRTLATSPSGSSAACFCVDFPCADVFCRFAAGSSPVSFLASFSALAAAATSSALSGSTEPGLRRSARILSETYCVTWTRISRPVVEHACQFSPPRWPATHFANAPSIGVSGNKGARAMLRPPKPQPTSANSTFLPFKLTLPWPSAGGGWKKVGKCVDQSILSGERGLFARNTVSARNHEAASLRGLLTIPSDE